MTEDKDKETDCTCTCGKFLPQEFSLNEIPWYGKMQRRDAYIQINCTCTVYL